MYLPFPNNPAVEVFTLVSFPALLAALIVLGMSLRYSIDPSKEPTLARQEAVPSGIVVTSLLILTAVVSDDSRPAPIFWYLSLVLVWAASFVTAYSLMER